MRRKVAVLAAVVLVLAVVCSSASGGNGRTKINLGIFNGPATLTAFVAEANGYFAKHGLNVALTPASSGPALLTLLLGNQVNIGDGGSALLTFPLLAQGQHLVGLRALNDGAFVGLIGQPGESWPHSSQPYPAPVQDLKGKTVGVIALGSVTDLILRYMLKDVGLTPGKDVNIVATGAVPTAVPAFSQHRVDAMISFPLIEPELESLGGYKVLLSPDEMPTTFQHFVNDHFVATKAYASSHPRVMGAFCKAMDDAVSFESKPQNFPRLVAVSSTILRAPTRTR